MSVEVYVQELLSRQALELSDGQRSLHPVQASIDRILELRKGNRLSGLQIKDLIHEGHKY